MSGIFDQEHAAHQAELDRAFAAGEHHARRLIESDHGAALAAARVKHARAIERAYKEGVEACLLYVCLFIAVLVAYGFFGRIVIRGIAGALT